MLSYFLLLFLVSLKKIVSEILGSLEDRFHLLLQEDNKQVFFPPYFFFFLPLCAGCMLKLSRKAFNVAGEEVLVWHSLSSIPSVPKLGQLKAS